MREFFERLVVAMSDLHQNDWSALNDCFHNDDYDDDDYQHFVHIKYCLAGFDLMEGRGKDGPETAHATLAKTIVRYVPHFTYLVGSDDGSDCLFQYTAYAEVASGHCAMYSGHGFAEFDVHDGNVRRLYVYSDDSHNVASLVSAALAQQQAEADEAAEEIAC